MNHSLGFLPVFFPIPNCGDQGGKPSCHGGESSSGERRSLQLPHPLRPGSPFKGSCLWEKARAHWPIFIYSLMSCKLVFLKIKSKKVVWFLFVWNTSRQSYLLSLFLCWLLNIFGLDGNVFIPRPSLIINVLIVGQFSCVCCVLDNPFLLAVLYNNALRWIRLTEHPTNCPAFSFVGFCQDLLQIFSF